MNHPFPFAAYLRNYLGIPASDSITIEPLSGGLTNHTVRAIFTEPTTIPGSSAQHQSLVIKHAPPYIAALGPEHMLSTRRQAIEARSLTVFAMNDAEDPILPGLLLRHPKIRLPRLLYHDEQKCILIMSDLGHIPTLLEYLVESPHAFPDAASTLAAFLADLHLSTRDLPEQFFYPFRNENSSSVIQDLVGSLPRRLLKLADLPDADVLGESVEQELASEKREPCFGIVDLWPGSILVGSDFVALVDWEYAGKSTAGSELGMLSAHLRFPLLSPSVSSELSLSISNFLRVLLSVYSGHSPVRSTAFTRSALLAHGRELINAVEFQSADVAGDQHKHALIQAGARCLRAAMFENREDRERTLSKGECLLLSDLI